MENNKIPTFILARSGRMRDGLVALLSAMLQIGTIHQLESALIELVPDSDGHQVLLVLDIALIDQELWSYLKQIRVQNPHCQCKFLVLVESTFQRRAARAAGADGVLLAGFPAAELFATIDNMFDQTDFCSVDKNGRKSDPDTLWETDWTQIN